MSQLILYSSLQVFFFMYCLSLHTTVKDLHAPKYSQTSPLFIHLLPSLALPLLHDAIPEAKQCAGLACRNLTHVLCIQYSHDHLACSYFWGDFNLRKYSLVQVSARS